MSSQVLPRSALRKRPMRTARKTVPASALAPAIARVNQDGPDFELLVREGQLLPAGAAVPAPVGPVLGPGEDQARVGWMDGDRLDVHALRQPLGEPLPLIATDGLPENPREGSRDACRGADVNVRGS